MRSVSPRRTGLWVLALTLTACAHGGGGRPSRPATEYYPLAVGNRWTYDVRFLGDRREQTVQITEERRGVFHDSAGGKLVSDVFGIRDDRRYLLREPLETGRTWTNVVSASSTERYKVVEAGAPCQTPAGRFPDCLRVESKNRVDEKTTLVNEVTFAAGVGIVRIQVVAETSGRKIPQTTLELKAFQLRPD